MVSLTTSSFPPVKHALSNLMKDNKERTDRDGGGSQVYALSGKERGGPRKFSDKMKNPPAPSLY